MEKFINYLKKFDGKEVLLKVVQKKNCLEVWHEEECFAIDKVEKTDTLVAKSILAYLNLKTSKCYKPLKTNLTPILARLRDGFVEDDFFTVIDSKCDEWTGTEFERFLRPATLFGNKMDSYLNATKTKSKKEIIDDVFSKRIEDKHEF